MGKAWSENDLSVDPASYQMADTDRRSFTFTAPTAWEVDVASVELSFARIDPESYHEIAGVASLVEPIDGKTANVFVDARGKLDREMVYQLDVTLVGEDGNTETMTLIVECVA